ncbi:hypothetical protein JOC77_002921 [Peribacillus deserti]|uniref:Nucleotide kinase n=1 Tax=Peribacillus deserti TaxID=673318 RepID=A0ABS2QJX8_9BACI|nr:hypothetical protein [Peribacillus deserti]MBM7693481.1 hypothetical protein [Peribacillus deserti]
MTGKVLNYFVCGHTARGFFNISESALPNLQHLFVINSQWGAEGSNLIEGIGRELVETGHNVEFIHSPFDSKRLDGVIVPSLGIGVVKEIIAEGARSLNCRRAIINIQPENHKDENITALIQEKCNQAYDSFSTALEIHDEWEEFYIHNMDFAKADTLTDELIHSFLGEEVLNKQSVVKHRFLGAATPHGSVDFVPVLTEEIQNRYFIKGRPGSGKSTLLKKLAKQAEHKGFDVEVYHCGFDPNSLDMVILRELGIAIFDSTAPHEYFPVRENDRIIDMYGSVITDGTDEKFAVQLADVAGRYKTKIQEATAFLKEARMIQERAEKESLSLHRDVLEKIKQEVIQEINRIS